MRHRLAALWIAAITLTTGCGGGVTGAPPETSADPGAGGSAPTTAGAGGSAPTTTGAGGAAPTPVPSFTQVYNDVLATHGCATSYCHDLVTGPPALGAVHNVYAHLVGVASPEAGCGAMELVAPGDVDHSLLYLKVSMAKPPCGSRMPTVGTPLDAAQVELIRAWIEGGAPE